MTAWPFVDPAPLTFASYVSECTECGAEVSAILMEKGGGGKLAPCGHKASITLAPNPRLRVPPATPEHE